MNATIGEASAAGGLAGWQQAIGRRLVQRQVLERESLRRYALALGADADVDAAQPPLAHWAFFLPVNPDVDTDTDGHARRGGFLPSVSLPRRMFAGSEIVFTDRLCLGEDAQLTSTVLDVRCKAGRSGALVFVEVEHALSQAGTPRVRERQSYVYRDVGERVPPVVPVAGTAAPGGEEELWQPGAVNLFRFSAATFNGHRIHYDLPYVRDVEGYPDLVVHGPFTAARLLALAMRRGPVAAFSFRAHAPLFLGQPIRLRQEGNELCALRCDGVTAMTATVGYA